MWRTSICMPAALAALTLAVAGAAADEFTLKSGAGPGQSWKGVTITGIEGDELVYRTGAGREGRQPLSRIFLIHLASDAAFNAAEEGYVLKQWDKAIDGYAKSARAGGDAWKIRYLAARMLDAAEKANRFDAAIVGFVALAKADPASAASIKPALPARGSKFLDDAVRDLTPAVAGATKDAERIALLSLLLDVQLARGDQPAAEAVVDQLLKLTSGTAETDPRLTTLVAEIRLGQARVAIEARRFADAAAAIEAASPRLTDPRQQAEALYLSAEAKLGLADPDNKAARLDAAVAFMRVVAHFGQLDGKPFVGQSMLRAAEILESAGSLAEARALCEQIVNELPDTAFAAEAARRIARLSTAR